MSERARTDGWRHHSIAVALCVAGAVILLLMTRWGIGTFPDSAHYIKGARHIVAELQGIPASGGDPGQALLTHHAPLYALLLAGGGLFGLDPLDGARWLNVALFAINIFLVGHIVRRSTRPSSWLWVIASLLVVGSMPVLSVHVSAMSEPLFLALALGGFLLLATYLEAGRRAMLIGSALAVGLAFMTRYAGAACILTGAAAVMWWGPAGGSRKVRDAVVFLAVSALPMLAWMMRNVAVANTATGREFAFHPFGRADVWQGIYTVSGWLLVPLSAGNVIRLGVLLASVVGLGVIVWRRNRQNLAPRPVVGILALFVGVYGVFLTVSISWFDGNTPLDDRILLPAYVAGLIVVLCLIDDLWVLSTPSALRGLVATGLVVLVAAHGYRSAAFVGGSYAKGWGFTSLAWQQSATLGEVRKLPDRMAIYSNAPEIIYLNTSRVAKPIPKRWLPMNRQANPAFDAQLDDVKQDLDSNGGVVVYFRGLTQAQRSLPSVDELTSRLYLRVLADKPDGEILGVSAPLHQ